MAMMKESSVFYEEQDVAGRRIQENRKWMRKAIAAHFKNQMPKKLESRIVCVSKQQLLAVLIYMREVSK